MAISFGVAGGQLARSFALNPIEHRVVVSIVGSTTTGIAVNTERVIASDPMTIINRSN